MPVRPLSPRVTRSLLAAGLLCSAGLAVGCRGEAARRLADCTDTAGRLAAAVALSPEGAELPPGDPFAAAEAAAGPAPATAGAFAATDESADAADGPAFAADFGPTLAALRADAAEQSAAAAVTLAAAVADPPAEKDEEEDPFAAAEFAAESSALAAAPTGPGDLFPPAGDAAEGDGSEAAPLFPKVPGGFPVADAGASLDPADPFADAADPTVDPTAGPAVDADPFAGPFAVAEASSEPPAADPFTVATPASPVPVLPAPTATEPARVSANGSGGGAGVFKPVQEPPALPAPAAVATGGGFDFGPPDLPPLPGREPAAPALPLPAPPKLAAGLPVVEEKEKKTADAAPARPRRLASRTTRAVRDAPVRSAAAPVVPPAAEVPPVAVAAAPAVEAVTLGPPSAAPVRRTASPAAPLAGGLGAASVLLLALAAWRRRSGLL